jgi:hypothetical protein
MQSANPRVFISYTATDEPFVKQIVPELRNADFDVWFAPAGLAGGERLSSIHDQIAASDAFIVILTRAAANSKWVQHEMNTALALQLDGKVLRILPVYLEEISRPPALADFASVRVSRDLEDPVPALVAALRGETAAPEDFMSKFSSYLQALIRIPATTCETLTNVEGMAASRWDDGSPRNVDPVVRQRVRDTVQHELTNAKVSEHDLSHVLRTFDRGQPLPIVDADKFTEIRSWLRRFGNDKSLVLAASLWAGVRGGLRGVTLEWLATDFLRHQLKIRGSDNELQWQAETLD